MAGIDEPIELSEYQAIWPRVFAEEQRRICQALNIPGDDLEHIGSTAVPGLAAKPIFDLMLGIGQLPVAARPRSAEAAQTSTPHFGFTWRVPEWDSQRATSWNNVPRRST